MRKYPKFSEKDYTAANQTDWRGRTDNGELLARFFQAVQCQSLDDVLASNPFLKPTIALLGFACDEGVRRNSGRAGAKEGPQALRQALGHLPLHDKIRDYQIQDVGTILVNNDLEAAQRHLGDAVHALIDKNAFPVILGGGHETAWGHFLGLREHVKSKNFAIVNFDAHFDMRAMLPGNLGSSGTPFLQIAEDRNKAQLPFNYYCLGIKQSSNTHGLFETAKQWNVKYLSCDEMYDSVEHSIQFIDNIINAHDAVYVSVCLDVFAATFAPGVSAASPYGLAPWQVLPLLKRLSASKKVIALDVVELSPQHDQNAITAKLGALCIAEFLYHYEHFHMA